MTNRQKSDHDRSFKVSIQGISRGRWSLIMQVLHDWLAEHEASSGCYTEEVGAVKDILKAIESHVVENYDGHSIADQSNLKPITDLERKALENARARRHEEIKTMEEFARSLGYKQGKKGGISKSRRKQITDSKRF